MNRSFARRAAMAAASALALASAANAQTVQVQQLPIAQPPVLPSNTAFWCATPNNPANTYWTTLQCQMGEIASTIEGSNNSWSGTNVATGAWTFTGSLTGTLTGNASTASALTPGATISVSGDASTASGVNFTGASSVTLPVTLATVNGNVGACGSATAYAIPTFNAKGLATGCTPQALGTFAFQNYATPPAIGGTTPNAGSFSTLSASGTVSGAGFSAYLSSPPAIGSTTPAAGSFTTLKASGTITPSTTNGIVGTTAGDNANAGSVGEFQSAYIVTTVTLTTATNTPVMSMTLSAGDWTVGGEGYFNGSANVTSAYCGANTASGTYYYYDGATTHIPAIGNFVGSMPTGFYAMPIPLVRFNLTASATIYLNCSATFASGTQGIIGSLWARRIR